MAYRVAVPVLDAGATQQAAITWNSPGQALSYFATRAADTSSGPTFTISAMPRRSIR